MYDRYIESALLVKYMTQLVSHHLSLGSWFKVHESVLLVFHHCPPQPPNILSIYVLFTVSCDKHHLKTLGDLYGNKGIGSTSCWLLRHQAGSLRTTESRW